MLTAVAPEHDRLSEPGDRAARTVSDAADGSGRPDAEIELLDFDHFYAAYRDEIGRALAFTLGSTTLGQEAVDEAMARAYQRWDKVREYRRPAGWVYRTGLNWGRSSLRSMFRRRRRERLVADGDDPATTPLTGVRTELIEALSRLSVDHRAVVVLRYYCDWSVTETAAALDIAEGTVQSRCSRALDQLRDLLDENHRGGRGRAGGDQGRSQSRHSQSDHSQSGHSERRGGRGRASRTETGLSERSGRR